MKALESHQYHHIWLLINCGSSWNERVWFLERLQRQFLAPGFQQCFSASLYIYLSQITPILFSSSFFHYKLPSPPLPSCTLATREPQIEIRITPCAAATSYELHTRILTTNDRSFVWHCHWSEVSGRAIVVTLAQ